MSSVTNQVIEISTDGRSFEPLVQSPNDDRSYIYRPYNVTTANYRLNVTFSNGRQYYSNVVTVKSGAPRPKLTATLVRSNRVIITSPGNYSYMIMDMTGKITESGKLVNGINTVETRNLTAGMYLIRFSNDSQQWTDKFIRQ